MPSSVGQYGTYMNSDSFPDSQDLFFHPSFFDANEQSTLLACSLKQLDAVRTRGARRRRKLSSNSSSREANNDTSSIKDLFLSDDLYEFDEGHYDGVIKNFREMHLTSWGDDYPAIYPILDRLKPLMPEVATQTHLLHLGSDGEILPHIDNIHASGSWIMGVSLGAKRVMRLESITNEMHVFDLMLPSGSVYMQRNSVRFGYKHSILKTTRFRGQSVGGGQRLSIMIRDRRLSAGADH